MTSIPRPYERQDVWALKKIDPTWDSTTLAYAKAIQVMKARDPKDPTSWSFQAGIHGSYDPPPKDAKWNQCQHLQWYFLPWHRMYVYYFERIVRAAVIAAGGPTDWALPYWNYDQPYPANTLPLPFRQAAKLPDGSNNPLFIPFPGRRDSYMQGAQLTTAMTSSAVAMDPQHEGFYNPPLSNFGGGESPPAHFGSPEGELEAQPHDIIHIQIGGIRGGHCAKGLMSDVNCAAADPIFWLHHANIDRLWVYWLTLGDQRKNPRGITNPKDQEWLKQAFPFYDENGKQVQLTCAEVSDTFSKLGYIYA